MTGPVVRLMELRQGEIQPAIGRLQGSLILMNSDSLRYVSLSDPCVKVEIGRYDLII
jgi:hypothetical protein